MCSDQRFTHCDVCATRAAELLHDHSCAPKGHLNQTCVCVCVCVCVCCCSSALGLPESSCNLKRASSPRDQQQESIPKANQGTHHHLKFKNNINALKSPMRQLNHLISVCVCIDVELYMRQMSEIPLAMQIDPGSEAPAGLRHRSCLQERCAC